MSAENGEDWVIVVLKRNGQFHWYKSERELWVLDQDKWEKDFVDAGYPPSDSDDDERFGIPVVNDYTMKQFLSKMEQYKVEKAKLENALKVRFPEATSWWDVGKLFPIMLVDCDKRHVSAFYLDGARMERYVPEGWTGEFDDFANNASEEDFPIQERFWVQDGVDLLAILNERGKKLAEHD